MYMKALEVIEAVELDGGDCVELKSGGPRMTVKSIIGDSVCCQWFDKTKLKEDVFHRLTLVKK